MNIRGKLLIAGVTLMALIAGINPSAGRDLPVSNVGGRQCYVYTVGKGENIYDISRSLNLPVAEITRYNPSASDGLRQGMRLYIPTSLLPGVTSKHDTTSATATPAPAVSTLTTTSVPEVKASVPQSGSYEVKKGETLYGISRKLGIPMETLIALNPQAEFGVKAGEMLVTSASVPEKAVAQKPATEAPAADTQIPAPVLDYSLVPGENAISQQTWTPVAEPAANDTAHMAVILPFMLADEEVNKTAQLFTEFYKGLLLAADSLSTMPGRHIAIHAYDSEGSTDAVTAIMQRPEMASMDIIIGPDNETQLEAIAKAMGPETWLYTAFNMRNALNTTNPHVIQPNTPHNVMYDKAATSFLEYYKDYTPVFLSRIDGAADKDSFLALLRQRYSTQGVQPIDVTYKNLLSLSDLEGVPAESNIVFVPVSGSRSEFAKITDAIRAYGQGHPETSTRLFGYPEWITFRGDYYNRLCDLGAMIYTRFYAAPGDSETTAIENRFKGEWDSSMLDAAPVQGILGWDTGMYLLPALRRPAAEMAAALSESSTGVQNPYSIKAQKGQGPANSAIMFVMFGPGTPIKTVIE